VRDEAEQARQSLAARYCIVTYIGIRMTSYKGSQVPRPHVEFVEIDRWLDAEVAAVLVLFLEGLVMATHRVPKIIRVNFATVYPPIGG
jgi:hypothetical protein